MTVAVANAVPLAPALNDPLTGRQVFPRRTGGTLDVSRAPVDSRSAQLISWDQRPHDWPDRRPSGGSTPISALHRMASPCRGRARQPAPRAADVRRITAARATPAAPACPAIPSRSKRSRKRTTSRVTLPAAARPAIGISLIVDRDRWLLYESYATRWNSSLSRWEAGSGAVFDLASNARRPDELDLGGCRRPPRSSGLAAIRRGRGDG